MAQAFLARFDTPPMPADPLRDQAYKHIHGKLLAGKLPAGHVVSELSLAREIGISRTPVREAIRRLEQEGILQQVPRYGTIASGRARSPTVNATQVGTRCSSSRRSAPTRSSGGANCARATTADALGARRGVCPTASSARSKTNPRSSPTATSSARRATRRRRSRASGPWAGARRHHRHGDCRSGASRAGTAAAALSLQHADAHQDDLRGRDGAPRHADREHQRAQGQLGEHDLLPSAHRAAARAARVVTAHRAGGMARRVRAARRPRRGERWREPLPAALRRAVRGGGAARSCTRRSCASPARSTRSGATAPRSSRACSAFATIFPPSRSIAFASKHHDGLRVAANSGERTRPECWRRRPADATFDRTIDRPTAAAWKFVLAGRQNQHSGRARSLDPRITCRVRNEKSREFEIMV